MRTGLLEKISSFEENVKFLAQVCGDSHWTPESLWEWLNRNHVSLHRTVEDDWLSQVTPKVRALFIKGDPKAVEAPSLAVVGTRRASSLGKAAAFRFSKVAAEHGVNVVSGLARGIDTVAHQGAIHSRRGKTVAVLGCGLAGVYPRENAILCEKIVAGGGAIVSEYLPDAPPLPHHFPLRNRIVAGISDQIFVIEAPLKSGALITAYWGLELGRDILCLAAPYDDEGFRGNHRLIQEGAKLICEERDLFSDDPPIERRLKFGSQVLELFAENRIYSTAELFELYLKVNDGDIAGLSRELSELVERGFLVECEPQHFLKS